MKDRKPRPLGGKKQVRVQRPRRNNVKMAMDTDNAADPDPFDFDEKTIPMNIVVGGFEEWTLTHADVQKAMRKGQHTEVRFVKSENNIFMRFIVPAEFVANRRSAENNMLYRWQYRIMDDDLVDVVVFHLCSGDTVVEMSHIDGDNRWVVDWFHGDRIELEQMKGGEKKKVVRSDDFLEDTLNGLYGIRDREEERKATNRQYVRNKRLKYPDEH